MAGKALLTRREVAQEYGVSEKTLANWKWAGTGPRYVKWARGAVRYRRADVETWLDQNTYDPTAGTGVA